MGSFCQHTHTQNGCVMIDIWNKFGVYWRGIAGSNRPRTPPSTNRVYKHQNHKTDPSGTYSLGIRMSGYLMLSIRQSEGKERKYLCSVSDIVIVVAISCWGAARCRQAPYFYLILFHFLLFTCKSTTSDKLTFMNMSSFSITAQLVVPIRR